MSILDLAILGIPGPGRIAWDEADVAPCLTKKNVDLAGSRFNFFPSKCI